MTRGNAKPTNAIDAYIARFPKETQKLLEQLRATILRAAPNADEVISYQIPAYRQHGILVYFAAYRNHIGLYPMASGISKFKKELSRFKGAKGSVQFPLDRPLPLRLIRSIVAFRVKDDLARAKTRAKRKK